jgi:hypothetical protein
MSQINQLIEQTGQSTAGLLEKIENEYVKVATIENEQNEQGLLNETKFAMIGDGEH